MQFVNNLNNLSVDDQYFMEVPVVQGASNVPTGNVGLVGTFSRGPLNTPTLVTSYQDLVKKFGDVDAALKLTGALDARGVFKQGNTNLYVVRVDSKANSSKAATLVLKDSQPTPGTVMTLNAESNGTWANSLVAIVSTGTISGTFKIVLQYGAESETWDNLVIQQPQTPIVGAVLASNVFGPGGLSNLANATFPTTPNTNLPKAGTYTFSGGDDGINGILPSDYIGANTAGVKTGLFALDSAPVNVVFVAGQSDPTVNQAVIDNCNNITQNGGLPRTGVITFPQGTQMSGLSTFVSSFDTDRIAAVYPWVQIYDPVTNTSPTVSPLGYMAGLIAQLDPHQSTGNKKINGILGSDPMLNIGPSDLTTMAQLQINAIGVQIPAGGIGVRGGFSLSKSSDSNQFYVRRMRDYIDSLVFTAGGQFVDVPVIDTLMRHSYQTVDNILHRMKDPESEEDKMIADYRVICDSTNNPPGLDRVICDYAVKLLNMNRFMIFRAQIGAGVVITSTQLGQ